MYFIQNDVTQICEALQKEIVARYNWKNVGEKLYQLIKMIRNSFCLISSNILRFTELYE